ncbi:hypothetical protein ACWA2C_16125 [Priestia megaterium]
MSISTGKAHKSVFSSHFPKLGETKGFKQGEIVECNIYSSVSLPYYSSLALYLKHHTNKETDKYA